MSNLEAIARKLAPTVGAAERANTLAIRDNALLIAELANGSAQTDIPMAVVNEIMSEAVSFRLRF